MNFSLCEIQLTLISFILCFSIYSQEVFHSNNRSFQLYTTKDGLPDNSVLSMLQDSKGYMWLGTFNGITRFDGSHFEVVSSLSLSPLETEEIFAILEDRRGNIWANSWGGVSKVDTRTLQSQFYHCFPEDTYTKGVDFKLHSLCEDFNGAIWAGSGYGLARIIDNTSLTHQSIKGYDYPAQLMNYFDQLENKRGLLASIDSVKENTDDSEWIELEEDTYVAVLSTAEMGPAIYDYGWIEDAIGNIVWKITDDPTFHGGGASDNRIGVKVLNLPKGRYVLRFRSDSGHNFNSWARAAPNQPKLWGIRAFRLDSEQLAFIESQIASLRKTTELAGSFVSAILRLDNGDIALGTNNGLSICSYEKGYGNSSIVQFENYANKEAKGYYANIPVITSLCKDDNGLWISGITLDDDAVPVPILEYLALSDSSTYCSELPLPRGASARKIIIDRQGHMWLGTNGYGVFELNRPEEIFGSEKFQITQYPLSPNKKLSTNFNEVFELCEDFMGNIWFGTWGDGLFKLNYYSRYFEFHQVDQNLVKSTQDVMIKSIIRDSDGNTWMGTIENGVMILDSSGILSKRHMQLIQNSELALSNQISALFEDSRGMIWLCSVTHGTFRYDPKSGRIEKVYEGHISEVMEDDQGNLWMCSGNGVVHYNTSLSSYVEIRTNSELTTSLSGNSVQCVFQDQRGQIWIGCDGTGLNKLTSDPGEIITSETQFSRYLPNASIRDITQDAEGMLWISTSTDGIIQFNENEGIVDAISAKHGLFSDQVESMILDNNGIMWALHPEAISRIDKKRGAIQNFTENDGLFLFDSQFNDRMTLNKSTGQILIGGVGGFYKLDTEAFTDNLTAPKIRITTVNGVADSKASESSNNKIFTERPLKLNFKNNFIAVSYVALDFDQVSDVVYQNRLEGLNESWVNVENSQSAQYAYLSPGSYTFFVRAKGRNGLWSQPASFHWIISPPWYLTWGAFAGYFTGFTFFILGYMKYLKKRALIRQQLAIKEYETAKLEEISRMKTRFYRNLSHEFRTPLTVILGVADQLSEQTTGRLKQGARMIKQNGTRILQLINQMLELSKLESGYSKFSFKNGNILDLLRVLVDSVSPLAQAKDITLQSAFDHPPIYMEYDESAIVKIVSNLLSNAIKYTNNGGEVKLFASKVEDVKDPLLKICITDNGKGIRAADIPKIFERFYQSEDLHEGTGIGLALTKELVDQLGGTIEVSSTPGKGSKFEVILPLRQKRNASNNSPASFNNQTDPNLSKQAAEDKDLYELDISTKINKDKAHLLLIEDNEDVIKYLKFILENNYQLSFASNGVEGLKIAKELIPDLIISDVMMPEMDGFELCHRVKTDELTSHIPVIMLTARVEMEDRLAGFRNRADSYITKPFRKEELLIRLKNLLDTRRSLRHYFNALERATLWEERSMKIEHSFLKKINAFVHNRLAEEKMGHRQLENHLGISKTQLYRKVKALTGLSVALYIRDIRLKKAHELLEVGDKNVSEVAFAVGFDNVSHFSRYFKDKFGYPPSNLR